MYVKKTNVLLQINGKGEWKMITRNGKGEWKMITKNGQEIDIIAEMEILGLIKVVDGKIYSLTTLWEEITKEIKLLKGE